MQENGKITFLMDTEFICSLPESVTKAHYLKDKNVEKELTSTLMVTNMKVIGWKILKMVMDTFTLIRLEKDTKVSSRTVNVTVTVHTYSKTVICKLFQK